MAARLLLFVRADSFTGTLNWPDTFTTQFGVLSQTCNVVIQTWGFGGGIDGDGQAIPAGGFDPLLAVFAGKGTQNGDPRIMWFRSIGRGEIKICTMALLGGSPY